MPAFATRSHLAEMMDDLSITDARLLKALDELRWVNVLLGGYRATMMALVPFLRRHRKRTLRVLDVGTGVADYPEFMVRWADRHGIPLEVVGVDVNPATVAYASEVLDRRLPPPLRDRIAVRVGDALDLPYEAEAFDVVTAALFLHHFEGAEAVQLLREMDRVARHGIVVNDLHRHPLAYYSILGLVHVLPVSPMFRNDGPVSVLRAFHREELEGLAHAAGLRDVAIRWRWAFRWVLSTV